MAEIIETTDNGVHTIVNHEKIPSNSKANAALTLGIIGTALGGLASIGTGKSLLGGLIGGGTNPSEGTYLERELADTRLQDQKQFYEGYINTMKNIHDDFDIAKQRDIDNSFMLYKYTRDSDDAIKSDIERNKDNAILALSNVRSDLSGKLAEVEKKVDIMAAVRPYQDALINEKIEKTGMIADFNLHRRTCRMIQGELILPSTSTVSGYESYSYWNNR